MFCVLRISKRNFAQIFKRETLLEKLLDQVMGALDDKLVWLDEFNKNIIDYDKVHYCVLWLLAVQCAHSFLANFHSNLLRLHPPPIFWSCRHPKQCI